MSESQTRKGLENQSKSVIDALVMLAIAFVCIAAGHYAGRAASQAKIQSLESQRDVCIKTPLDSCKFPHDSEEHHAMLSASLADWRLIQAMKTDSALKAQEEEND